MTSANRLLAEKLNEGVQYLIRWCTPSILLSQVRVGDIYGSDVSVSASSFGDLLTSAGSFRDLTENVAKAYGSHRVLVSVNGTTGSNWIVARYFALGDQEIRTETASTAKPVVLVARNCHHSVVNAFKALAVRFRFIDCGYLDRYGALLPPSPEQVAAAVTQVLATGDRAAGIILSNPTYEGLSARMPEIISLIRKTLPDATIVVDEAWGAHLPFADPKDKLPKSAIELGADIILHSTHKQGGSLQQTAIVHYRREEFDEEALLKAYREYSTTSPSYHLVASIEAAAVHLKTDGRTEIGRAIRHSANLIKELKAQKLDIEYLNEVLPSIGNSVDPTVYDWTKVTVSTYRYPVSGHAIRDRLENEFHIVVEKASPTAITLVGTFQLPTHAARTTGAAISELLRAQSSGPAGPKLQPSTPFASLGGELVYEPYLVSRLNPEATALVPFGACAGKISAEAIEIYPPGIPVLLEGYRITLELLKFLNAAKQAGARLVCRDRHLSNLLVVSDS